MTEVRINFRIVAVVTHYQDAVVLQRSESRGGASGYCNEKCGERRAKTLERWGE